MKALTGEWVGIAEDDFASLKVILRPRKKPNYGLACFLAQQCTEKYLKARLFEAGIPFAKTHDLTVLLSDVAPVEPAWTLFAADLRLLSDYAVRFRYPGKPANRSVARDAVGRCKDFRAAARLALGLK